MTLTKFRNCKTFEVRKPEEITNIREGKERSDERNYPYSDVTIFDPIDQSGYNERVVESMGQIIKLCESEGIKYHVEDD